MRLCAALADPAPHACRSQEDLPRIENALRVPRALDRAHQLDHICTILRYELGALALADAMLAGARAADAQRAIDHRVIHFLGALPLVRGAGLEQEQHM